MYLFSFMDMSKAQREAKKMGLKRHQWVYVPIANRKSRDGILRGRIGVEDKHLIGHFDEWEKFFLTGNRKQKGDAVTNV